MTEPKPGQQYEVVPNMDALTKPTDTGGNGQQPAVPPTIDEQSRQKAMARAMLENDMVAREQTCADEIKETIAKIAERHGCVVQFIETRINGQVAEIGLRSVAVERLKK